GGVGGGSSPRLAASLQNGGRARQTTRPRMGRGPADHPGRATLRTAAPVGARHERRRDARRTARPPCCKRGGVRVNSYAMPASPESLRLEAVTVCVGFDDILDVTLALNHPHLDTMIVVTSHDDKRTHHVAHKH